MYQIISNRTNQTHKSTSATAFHTIYSHHIRPHITTSSRIIRYAHQITPNIQTNHAKPLILTQPHQSTPYIPNYIKPHQKFTNHIKSHQKIAITTSSPQYSPNHVKSHHTHQITQYTHTNKHYTTHKLHQIIHTPLELDLTLFWLFLWYVHV